MLPGHVLRVHVPHPVSAEVPGDQGLLLRSLVRQTAVASKVMVAGKLKNETFLASHSLESGLTLKQTIFRLYALN